MLECSWNIFPNDKAGLSKKSTDEAELFPQPVGSSPSSDSDSSRRVTPFTVPCCPGQTHCDKVPMCLPSVDMSFLKTVCMFD